MSNLLPTEKSVPEHTLGRYTFLLHGHPKVGKTTFCSDFPDTLFLLTTPAPEALSLYKKHVSSWSEAMQVFKALRDEDHGFKTVIIDPIEQLYQYCREHVRKQYGFTHESEEDFGRGWEAVGSEFKTKLAKLSSLGLGLGMISHSEMKKIEDVEGRERYRIVPMLDKTSGRVVRHLVSFILYAEVDGQGNRLLRTQPSIKFEAGVRTPKGVYMPDPVPLEFEAFEEAFRQTFKGDDE